jgi:low temperature requirement protein LtrA
MRLWVSLERQYVSGNNNMNRLSHTAIARSRIGSMSRFWQVLSLLLLAVFAGFLALRVAFPWNLKGFQPPGWAVGVVLALAMTLVAALWAIAFRRQLERGRLRPAALVALLLMEGGFLWLASVLNPGLLPLRM